MNWLDLVQVIITFIGGLAGSGPWGIAAMVLGGLGLAGGVGFVINKWNKGVDAGDIARSGADSGNTAVDLKNQADRNRDYENAEREKIKKEGPPK